MNQIQPSRPQDRLPMVSRMAAELCQERVRQIAKLQGEIEEYRQSFSSIVSTLAIARLSENVAPSSN